MVSKAEHFWNTNRFPVIIFLLTLAAGILAGFYFKSINPLTYDVDGFGKDAATFADNLHFNGSVRRPPLYPFLLGLLYIVFGNFNHTAMIVFHTVVLGLTGVVVYKISNRIYNSKINAFITGLVVTLNPVSLWYIPFYFIELVFTFFVVATLYMGYKAYRFQNVRDGVLFGILLGISTLGKGVVLLFPFSLAAALILFKIFRVKSLVGLTYISIIKTFVLSGIIMFLVILPWAIRNKNVSGKWILVSSNAGVEFFRGNVFAENNSYKLKNELGSMLTESFKREEKILDSLGLENPTPLQLDSVFNPMMKSYVMKTPGKFAIKIVKQIPTYWTLSQNYKSSLIRVVIVLILFGLFAAGFVIRPGLFNFFVLIIAVYMTLVYAAVYAIARYSFPLYPLLLIPGVFFIYDRVLRNFFEKLPEKDNSKS